MMTFTLDFTSVVKIDDEQFAQICKNNPDVQFERSAAGELIIMPPVGAESGNRRSTISVLSIVLALVQTEKKLASVGVAGHLKL